MVAKVESASANVTVDLAGRLLTSLGVTLDLRYRAPFADPRQRDVGHARCVGYVRRRLEGLGLDVEREVEIVHGGSHGWIDVLAFNRRSGDLIVIEVKTQLDDLGRIERTLSWYEREAGAAARRLGWRPRGVTTWLLLLATRTNDARLLDNRAPLAQSFPIRAPEMAAARGGRALAMIDPRSRRRAWLMRTTLDGRRSAARYADYAEFVRSFRTARARRVSSG